jgi:hypothetical protein
VLDWVEVHMTTDPRAAATWTTKSHTVAWEDDLLRPAAWTERDLALAGEGAPSMAEFALYDLAAAIGMSADSARKLIARLLGEIARATMTLDLTQPDPTTTRAQAGSPLTIYVSPGDPVARVVPRRGDPHHDPRHRPGRLGARSPKITIKIIGDLDTCDPPHDPAPGYAIPDRHHEHIRLRDPQCVFPHCPRTARACDTDHITPHPAGPTCPCNLASR